MPSSPASLCWRLACLLYTSPFTLIPGVFWFLLKILVCLFVFVWVRATLPRFRYDQIMSLGWKVFLPISLIWLVLTASFLEIFGLLPHA